jgi:hypothetical protein
MTDESMNESFFNRQTLMGNSGIRNDLFLDIKDNQHFQIQEMDENGESSLETVVSVIEPSDREDSITPIMVKRDSRPCSSRKVIGLMNPIEKLAREMKEDKVVSSPHSHGTQSRNQISFSGRSTGKKKMTVIEQEDGCIKLGKYYGVLKIGEGSFGKVYQAIRVDNKEPCAIKVINKEKMRHQLAKGAKK